MKSGIPLLLIGLLFCHLNFAKIDDINIDKTSFYSFDYQRKPFSNAYKNQNRSFANDFHKKHQLYKRKTYKNKKLLNSGDLASLQLANQLPNNLFGLQGNLANDPYETSYESIFRHYGFGQGGGPTNTGFPIDSRFYGLTTGFGYGGYGDPTHAVRSLSACTSESEIEKGENCLADYPGAGEYQWRFIKNLGWRKLSHWGAASKDWWDFKRTVRLPFIKFDPFWNIIYNSF